jgi:hypothetical protein
VCESGRCIAVRTAPRATECQTDGDCVVANLEPSPTDACRTSLCGCCPRLAVVAGSRPLTRQEGPQTQTPKKADGPTFGLSDGKPSSPPPQCSPCSVEPVRAACVQGQCRGVPAQPVRPRPQPAG